MHLRQLFLNNIAQTSKAPLMLEVDRAQGIYIYDKKGKQYIDLIAGISVSNLGHCHPKVVAAVQQQAKRYMHTMVYGEFIQSPQVMLASLLVEHLPACLDNVYFVNSGAEATEGALKLAKRYTNKSEIIAFKNGYHGSTMGALSIMGDEHFKQRYRPLVPGSRLIEYGDFNDLKHITDSTAAVIIEPIQAESGITIPPKDYLKALRKKCTEVGALLILDEIQTGLGRTGALFAFQRAQITPDILLLAKGLGGGMPIGAFISSQKIMSVFKENPILGHITTFGGHPVNCAAAHASLSCLLEDDYIEKVEEKGQFFEKLLNHRLILEKRRKGLMMSLIFKDFEQTSKIISHCLDKGLITDWFLFKSNALRIAPPLIISKAQIQTSCRILLDSMDDII